jgi:hypothetical protein
MSGKSSDVEQGGSELADGDSPWTDVGESRSGGTEAGGKKNSGKNICSRCTLMWNQYSNSLIIIVAEVGIALQVFLNTDRSLTSHGSRYPTADEGAGIKAINCNLASLDGLAIKMHYHSHLWICLATMVLQDWWYGDTAPILLSYQFNPLD